MHAERLKHLIYTSVAVAALDPPTMKSILEFARINNAKRSVNGMLLLSAGNFFQVLEGDEHVVDEVFATIAADPRHKRVTKIIDEPIAKRDFADWSMGFAEAAPEELTSMEGLNDFFQDGRSLANLHAGRAKKLLYAFAEGRWHRPAKSAVA